MCTTMILTPGTTANGAMVVTHSGDDDMGDQRVIAVPAADHAPGATRPVLPRGENYPRINTLDRGPFYHVPEFPLSVPLGHIPQVDHTYAYYDANYGVMNEHSLLLGECTNGARYRPDAVPQDRAGPGRHQRLFYSEELSKVALERCKGAREAITLMGKLIDEFGFYSDGETLLVADTEEAWVMEMCALPSDDDWNHSAWIAQRVPDGHVFVAANTFRIREITGGDDQIHPTDLKDRIASVGYWDPEQDQTCDWFRAVSEGEEHHPYYSLRRIWRVFDRVNSDLGLIPYVEDTYSDYYPFSVPANRKLTRPEIFGLYRDHYEGTPFDLTRGIAAGPYGDPHRSYGKYDSDGGVGGGTLDKKGAWERPISVDYQGFTHILESHADWPKETGAVMWFGPDVAYTTVFTPFWAGACDLPVTFQTGNPRLYDETIAFWIFNFAGTWARLNWQRMTEVDIKPFQAEIEARSFEIVDALNGEFCTSGPSIEQARDVANQNAADVLAQWSVLGRTLIAKYSQGFINPAPLVREDVTAIGYSADWLDETDYTQGPTAYGLPVGQN